MENRELAKKYAEALLNNLDPGQYSEACEDVDTFSELMAREPGIRLLLGSPAIPEEDKRNLIRRISERGSFLEVSGRFLLLLFDKERIGLLSTITGCMKEMVMEHEGRVVASVVTAVHLSQEQENGLREKLCTYTGKNVEMEVTVDTSLVSGMVVRVGDRIIDSSITNAFSGLKESLIEGL